MVITLMGWLGALGLLAAYFLSLAKKMSNQSYAYLLINAFCSIFLIVNAAHLSAYPFVLINTLWAITSFYHVWTKSKTKKGIGS